jgi:hypothetical protein
MWKGHVINLKEYLPIPKFDMETIYKDGDTSDIMTVVLTGDADSARNVYTRKLAVLFELSDEYDTCEKIFNNVKHNVDYSEDEEGHEIIKYPIALLYADKGDCKSFSLLIADLLRGVHGGKIKFCYRFVSQHFTDPTPHHVFIVATLSDGTEVSMDCVYGWFDREPFYFHHIDKKGK